MEGNKEMSPEKSAERNIPDEVLEEVLKYLPEGFVLIGYGAEVEGKGRPCAVILHKISDEAILHTIPTLYEQMLKRNLEGADTGDVGALFGVLRWGTLPQGILKIANRLVGGATEKMLATHLLKADPANGKEV